MPTELPLTIALVSTQREWYGGEQQLWLLAEGLRSRGHRVHILARRGGKLAERMSVEGFAVRQFAGNGRSPLGLWQLHRHLRRLRPEVLHYNDSHALTAAGLATCGLHIPVRIATRHVVWPIRSPWRFGAFCDRVVCVSHAVADAGRAAGLSADMLRVVFASTDPQEVLAGDRQKGRLAAGLDDDRPMIVVIAGLNENKGHAFLLDALPAVLERHAHACLVLAGDGPEKESLERQARRLEIVSSVRFLGYRRDVPDLLQAADLVVLPSLAEGLPVTLLDAMFADTPIVATAVGGTVDLLSSDATGRPMAWLVPPADSNALAAAIIDALDHPEQRRQRADLARHRAEQTFTADRMVDAMLQVYREVLDEKGVAPCSTCRTAAKTMSTDKSRMQR